MVEQVTPAGMYVCLIVCTDSGTQAEDPGSNLYIGTSQRRSPTLNGLNKHSITQLPKVKFIRGKISKVKHNYDHVANKKYCIS